MDPLVLGIRHVALNVKDVAKAVDFYTSALGMRLEWLPDSENAYLTSGTDNLALHKLPEGSTPGAVQRVHHIGFVVRAPEHVDQWAERLRARGIALAQEPKTHRDGARSLYLHDPDGLLIQLLYHPPISDQDSPSP
jgi:catechol 2,3-dioxygenase-like lactoylglutathione lyase family enzyme